MAKDHAEDDLCSPCLRSVRDYNPRLDPFFRDKLLAVLSEAQGRRVEPLKALGLAKEHRYFVRDQIMVLRREGFVIQADARVAGYKYLGYVETMHREKVDSSDATSEA